MDVRTATVLPTVAASPEHARALLALDGTALVRDVTSLETAIEVARSVLGDHLVRINRQFEVTREQIAEEAAVVTAQAPDERGRMRRRGPMEEHQPAHNDGFGFGDFAPDHIFLWCRQPCAVGGASFLVDAGRLLAVLSERDPAFGRFAWTVPIDHSMPNFPHPSNHPIARTVHGRLQVRCHPDLAAAPGPDERHDAAFVRTWTDAVAEARHRGIQFRLAAGELLCIDNYRMLHGRNGYVGPERSVSSIWAWTKEACRIPAGQLDIATPDLAGLHPVV